MRDGSQSGDPAYRVLLIEDDHFKQELIEQALCSFERPVEITLGRSVQHAVQLVRNQVYDLIILDIALPSHESRPGGAQPLSQPSGGVEVLLELSYEARSDEVVILTQYPEIEYDGRLYPLSRFHKAISEQVSVNIGGVLLFNPQGQAWREQLKKVIG